MQQIVVVTILNLRDSFYFGVCRSFHRRFRIRAHKFYPKCSEHGVDRVSDCRTGAAREQQSYWLRLRAGWRLGDNQRARVTGTTKGFGIDQELLNKYRRFRAHTTGTVSRNRHGDVGGADLTSCLGGGAAAFFHSKTDRRIDGGRTDSTDLQDRSSRTYLSRDDLGNRRVHHIVSAGEIERDKLCQVRHVDGSILRANRHGVYVPPLHNRFTSLRRIGACQDMVVAQDVLVAARVLHHRPERTRTTERIVDVLYIAPARAQLDRRRLLTCVASKTESRTPENQHEPFCGQLTTIGMIISVVARVPNFSRNRSMSLARYSPGGKEASKVGRNSTCI